MENVLWWILMVMYGVIYLVGLVWMVSHLDSSGIGFVVALLSVIALVAVVINKWEKGR